MNLPFRFIGPNRRSTARATNIRIPERGHLYRLVLASPFLKELVDVVRPPSGHVLAKIAERPLVESMLGDDLGCVLDLGYGVASYAGYAAPRARAYVAVDLPAAGIPLRLAQAALTCRQTWAVHADGRVLPFAERAFDTVLCTQVLEHIREHEQVAAELARVLKPGGRAVVGVPMPPAPYPDANHVREGYTPEELEGLLGAAGLELEEVAFCCWGLGRRVIQWTARWGEHRYQPPGVCFLPLLWLDYVAGPAPGDQPFIMVARFRK